MNTGRVFPASKLCRAVVVALLAVATPQVVRGQAAPATADYQVNQPVEAREGDTWSPATVVAREGRKIQIKYPDGTLEWVTADRLRAPGKPGAKPATPPVTPAVPATPPATPATPPVATPGNPPAAPATGNPPAVGKPPAPPEQYRVGAKIEAKEASTWKKATIKNRDGDLYLVVFDGWDHQMHWQWVHVSMVRNPGSDKQGPGWATGEHIGGRSLIEAKAAAKKKFADMENQLADEAEKAKRDEEKWGKKGGHRDPFAPKAYDKPVLEVKLDSAPEKSVTQAPGRPAAPAATGIVRPAGPVKFTSNDIPLKGEGSIHWSTNLVFNGAFALVVSMEGSEHEPSSVRVERVDLAAGQASEMIRWETNSVPVAISPTGQRVLSRAPGFFSDTKHRVDLWDFSGSPPAPKHIVSFEPYRGQKDRTRDVMWAALVDDEHALTCSSGSLLVLWEMKSGAVRPLWRMPVESTTGLAMGPGGRTVACMSKYGLAVIDVSNGTTLGLIPIVRKLTTLDYSPDGKFVVGASGATLSAYDLEKGQFVGDIGVPMETSAREVSCGNDGIVLLDQTAVFDIASKQIVWSYEGGNIARGQLACYGGRMWRPYMDISGRKGRMLQTSPLPHEPARQTAKQLAANADANLILKPGTSVTLEIALEGDEKQVKSATDAITAELGRRNIKVADNQPIRVVARTEDGKTTEKQWESRSFGPGAGFGREVTTASVTEKITRIYVEWDGKIVWENKTVSVPSFVTRKQGESVAEAVGNANRHNLAFLESVRVPGYIAKPRDPAVIGKSKWGESGLQD